MLSAETGKVSSAKESDGGGQKGKVSKPMIGGHCFVLFWKE